MTRQQLHALRILSALEEESFALDIVKCSGSAIPRGTVYRVLAHLEVAGLVTSHPANSYPSYLSAPRRLYRLTPAGRTLATR